MDTPNNERLVRYLDSLGAEPSTPRVREYVLALFALFLALAYLDSGNLAAQIVEERHEQIIGCISQYGPGERWARTNAPVCAPMGEVPNSILTYPLAAQ